jgi:hypothetical protein
LREDHLKKGSNEPFFYIGLAIASVLTHAIAFP